MFSTFLAFKFVGKVDNFPIPFWAIYWRVYSLIISNHIGSSLNRIIKFCCISNLTVMGCTVLRSAINILLAIQIVFGQGNTVMWSAPLSLLALKCALGRGDTVLPYMFRWPITCHSNFLFAKVTLNKIKVESCILN